MWEGVTKILNMLAQLVPPLALGHWTAFLSHTVGQWKVTEVKISATFIQ